MTERKPPMELAMDWKGELRFEAEAIRGRSLRLDGNSQDALSPMEALLGSLCGCMAIDVVMILKKMRAEPESIRIEALGERQDDPPRYFRKVNLRFLIQGDLAREKVERAIQLSFDKYCSVFHSLRQDLVVEHEITLQPAAKARL